MADPIPTAPPSTAKLRAADLQLLEEDARRFVVRDRPATDALWLALLKPRDRILREWAYTQARAKLIAEGQDAGLLDPLGRTLAAGPAALVAMAETMVAKAILGDGAAQAQIMARIEGLPAQRKLDESEAAESRATMIAGIESLVRAMNAQRPGDQALDVKAETAFDRPSSKPNGKGNGHDDGTDEPGGPAKP